MLDTATIIAHVMFRHGANLGFAETLAKLDLCLEPASQGAYTLVWDSEDLMVAEFGLTRIILVAGHQVKPLGSFSLTIAISPKDEDAISCPTLPTMHRHVIKHLVAQFEQRSNSNGVLWQRAKAPITPEAVEDLVDALEGRLALLDSGLPLPPAVAHSIDTAQVLPESALALQFRSPRTN